MIDAVLDTLVAGRSFSRVPVAQRGILFDRARTLAAFMPNAVPRPSAKDLRLRTPAGQGDQTLLSDCSQIAPKPCSGLGWGVYVWCEPLSVTDSDAVVRVFASWADRSNEQFQPGVAPGGRTWLVWFAADVSLAKGRDGAWRATRIGRTAVG